MALWQAGDAILLICQLLVVASSGVTSLQSFTATSRFEDFGNFGGFRGFHQFHGWLSNALDDNTGSQSQGFPAGYSHPATDDDTFVQILPGRQQELEPKLYQTTSKPNNVEHPEVHVKSKKFSKKTSHNSDHEVPILYDGKIHNVHESITSAEQPKDYRYTIPVKEKESTTEENASHKGSVYNGAYESMKLHQKQYKPPEYSKVEEQRTRATERTNLGGGVYDSNEPTYHQQVKSSKYAATPKQPASMKEKHIFGRISTKVGETSSYKPMKRIQKLKVATKFAPTANRRANNARKIYRENAVYHVGNSGGFLPILHPPQRYLKAAKYATDKQQAGKRGNTDSNSIYVYPNPYQQTLAAINPIYRGVIKLQPPLEHHKNYLSYKPTLSSQVI